MKYSDFIRLLIMDEFMLRGKGYRLTAHLGCLQITSEDVPNMESRPEIKLRKFRGVWGHSWGPRDEVVQLIGLIPILYTLGSGFLRAPSQGFEPVGNTLDMMGGAVERFGSRGFGQALFRNAPGIARPAGPRF